jgi:hypothetical protein
VQSRSISRTSAKLQGRQLLAAAEADAVADFRVFLAES